MTRETQNNPAEEEPSSIDHPDGNIATNETTQSDPVLQKDPLSEPDPPNALLSPARLRQGLVQAATLTSEFAKKFSTVIKGDYSVVLSPYAAYALRVLAVLVLVLSVFNPVFSLGETGIVAWVQTVALNIAVAFGLFVVAEVVLIQRDIASALKAIAEQSHKDAKDDG